MKKLITIAALGAATIGLSACAQSAEDQREDQLEEKADDVRDDAEQKADALEQKADN